MRYELPSERVSVPYACHRVDPEDELQLYARLLKAGVADRGGREAVILLVASSLFRSPTPLTAL